MIIDEIKSLFKPKENIGITAWAEKHLVLGAKQPTAFHGKYKGSRTPYMPPIHDMMCDSKYNRITLCFGAQTGKTLNGTIVPLMYFICEDPDPIIVAFPNETLAQSRSESSIMPMIFDSKYVTEKVISTVRNDLKKLEYILNTCVVNLIGGNSPANMASRPARIVFIEEADKFPDQTKKEAKAINLLWERTKSFWNKKIIENSTPTIPTAHMWQAYLDGNQMEYNIPCQKCGFMQSVEFEDFVCDKDSKGEFIPKTAKWRCRGCEKHNSDKDLNRAVKYGKWIATSESKDPKHVSARLPAWYALWVSMEDVFLEFNRSKDVTSEYQNFVNSWCARAYIPKPLECLADEQILEIQKSWEYPQGTIPQQYSILFATVDVQKSHLPYCVWATDYNNMWLVDFGKLPTFEDIVDVKQKIYRDNAGNDRYVKYVFMDTGYRTMEAYAFALGRSWVIPIKGEKGTITNMTKPIRTEKITSYPTGESFGGNKHINLTHVHPRYFKDELMASVNNREESKCKIWFCEGIEKDNYEFVRQFTAEQLIELEEDKHGFKDTMYKKKSNVPNDFFDLSQYGFLARHILHEALHLLKKRLEKSVDNGNA